MRVYICTNVDTHTRDLKIVRDIGVVKHVSGEGAENQKILAPLELYYIFAKSINPGSRILITE